MRAFSILTLAGCTWLALGSTAFADVQISIHDGQVSIVAKDATVRQILTEWARVGRTKIVNVERIAGGPVTIELRNMPEPDALDVLLRSVSGYMAAPRAPFVSDASQFDRIIVMPTSAAPRPATSSAPPQPQPPQFGQLSGVLQPSPEDENVMPGGLAMPPALAPIFANFPQPQTPGNPRRAVSPGPGLFVGQPQQTDPQISPQGLPLSTPATQQAAPFGAVSAPGMIAPPPGQPGLVIPQVIQQRRSPND